MIKLSFITNALQLVASLFSAKTPKVGENIIQGAKEISKIGHLLNGVTATIISGIALSDFELLFSYWEKDKPFFLIVLLVMQAPYVISAYVKAVGRGQAEADQVPE